MNEEEWVVFERRVNAFALEIRAVCEKHGLSLWSCSCCGGINVEDLEGEREEASRGDTERQRRDPLDRMVEDLTT